MSQVLWQLDSQHLDSIRRRTCCMNQTRVRRVEASSFSLRYNPPWYGPRNFGGGHCQLRRTRACSATHVRSYLDIISFECAAAAERAGKHSQPTQHAHTLSSQRTLQLCNRAVVAATRHQRPLFSSTAGNRRNPLSGHDHDWEHREETPVITCFTYLPWFGVVLPFEM